MLEIVRSNKGGDFHNLNCKTYIYDFKCIYLSDVSDDVTSIVEWEKLFWNLQD